MHKNTHLHLLKMHQAGEKIAVLTSYDASFARICEKAGVDCILVGDSLGMVIQGQNSTVAVTLKDMIYHTKIVSQAVQTPLIIADLPFGTFQISPQQAYYSAVKLVRAGADVIKTEGGLEMVATTEFLSSRGIAVCAHIGLTPQSVNVLGGYGVQGKQEQQAKQLIDAALAHQKAGAVLVLLEAIPEKLANIICQKLLVPTIGIGASQKCSGQVLVIYDILNISSGSKPKFVKDFSASSNSIQESVANYVKAVKDGSFPGLEHIYSS